MIFTYIIYNIIKEQRSNKKYTKIMLTSFFIICKNFNFFINMHKCSYIFYIYLNQFMIYYITSRSNFADFCTFNFTRFFKFNF